MPPFPAFPANHQPTWHQTWSGSTLVKSIAHSPSFVRGTERLGSSNVPQVEKSVAYKLSIQGNKACTSVVSIFFNVWDGPKKYLISYNFYHRSMKSHLPYLRGTAMGSGVLQKKQKPKSQEQSCVFPELCGHFPGKGDQRKMFQSKPQHGVKQCRPFAFFGKSCLRGS